MDLAAKPAVDQDLMPGSAAGAMLASVGPPVAQIGRQQRRSLAVNGHITGGHASLTHPCAKVKNSSAESEEKSTFCTKRRPRCKERADEADKLLARKFHNESESPA